ncbi:MAG TPA: dTDP-4-dehydrorhamnose 3,5-epimerase [Candidatus Limnocylindria bacterium]|nr:dTDP-4-dehydrorhamnose 3,5-epimerase [Candidatus Limnocylindria bacterium]
MVFTETALKGAFLIRLEPTEDERGFFARTFCVEEFQRHGLNARLVQCSISFSHTRGTLRGMHYQFEPHAEAKLIRVTRGAIFDAIIDLRPKSPTFRQHVVAELTAENRQMIYAPEGFAHGFQTLEDNTEVFYQMSAVFAPAVARGVRWDDPAFGIQWPEVERCIMNGRDASYPDFQ